jgi:peptide/nickel transport system permease protein
MTLISDIAAPRTLLRLDTLRRLPFALRSGLVILTAEVVIAVLANWLYPGDPFDLAGAPFLAPWRKSDDPQFPLGTDILGRDIAAGLVHGARISLIVGFSATALAVTVGTTVGLLSGYLGGGVDHVLMRVTELFQVIPHFLLAIILVAILGARIEFIVLAIGLTSWSMVARLVRAETLALRELDYVRICVAMGGGPVRVMLTHILPNVLPPIIVAASILTALAVLTEAGLAFFGLSDSNHISWGGMIGASRDAQQTAPYMTLIPGLAIVVTVMALSLIGDGLTALLRRGDGA